MRVARFKLVDETYEFAVNGIRARKNDELRPDRLITTRVLFHLRRINVHQRKNDIKAEAMSTCFIKGVFFTRHFHPACVIGEIERRPRVSVDLTVEQKWPLT